MRTKIYRLLLLIVMVGWVGLLGCEQEVDPFFDPPKDLQGGIYQTLQARGNFTNYLKCLDKTPYAAGLSKSGSWTVFAPDDEAFEKFLNENNYASVDDIPYKRMMDIIRYSIILDAYNSTTLTYYKNQWYAGSSCRRYTQVQDTIVELDAKDYPNFQNWEDRKYKVYPRTGQTIPVTYFIQSYIDNQAMVRCV